jgi:hypothetical protein
MNRLLAVVAAIVLAVGTQAAAAAWPEKPINASGATSGTTAIC